MSNNNCVIVFDQNEHGTYFTGQTVTGKVIITFNKSKKLKGIKLQICGYASCQWREKHGRKRVIHKIKAHNRHVYYGREDYIASTTFLMGSEHSTNFSVDAGTYTYTFACPIPDSCPSSFEGTYGHIRYLTKVTFLRSGASDRTQNVGFTVLKLLDLNQESRLLKAPANNEALENVCFFHTKAVHMKVNLMQTGFVPGQFILVSANVNNQSAIDCKKLIILLNLRATYTADTSSMRSISEKMCLVKKICGPVQRHTQKDFAESVRVPATPPTCEHLSKVVRVSYEVCVIAVMNHLMRNPKTVIPLTIGSVPLVTALNATVAAVAAVADEVPTTSARAVQAPPSVGGGDDLPPGGLTSEESDGDESETEAEMDLPPPTYEEAMFMTTNIADDDANTVSEATQFTPRYPVYNVDEMYAANNNNNNGLSPPPNLPQKRRRRRKKNLAPTAQSETDKPPMESPVEI